MHLLLIIGVVLLTTVNVAGSTGEFSQTGKDYEYIQEESSTIPDDDKVETGSVKEFTNVDVSEQQKQWMNIAAENYLNSIGVGGLEETIDGHGGVLYIYKNTAQMSDAEILDYMTGLIQSNPLQLNSEIREVNYKYAGMTETKAYSILEVIEFTEGFIGKKVPSDFREQLFESGLGISDSYIARIMADGESYYEVKFSEYSVQDGKLVAVGNCTQYNSGGGVMLDGTGRITATFYANDESIMGMSLDFIKLSES